MVLRGLLLANDAGMIESVAARVLCLLARSLELHAGEAEIEVLDEHIRLIER
jgi:hypothetical protein